jgi:UDP-glucose 4-epimerase
MSKIVVLGADGFIGKNLIRKLASNSADEIVAFDRFSAYQHHLEHPFNSYPNVTITPGDFFNRADVTNVLKNADFVFHLISVTTPATANDDPFIDVETNIRGSIELFELCSHHKVKKIVFLSSGGTVYGDIDSDSINEMTLTEPRSPYGISKITIEHYLRYFKFTTKLNYIVYRVANPYGPGQNVNGKQGVIPIFMHKVLNEEPVSIFGDGGMVRDYIYISDLIEMIAGSYAKDNIYNEYNLGCGRGESVNDIVLAIEKCTGKNIERAYLPKPSTFVDRSVLDIGRFVNEFGIKPRTNLEAGIQETWKYVQEIQ